MFIILILPAMTKNFTVNVFLSLAVINFCSCNSGKVDSIKSTQEIRNEKDTIEFKRVASNYSEGKLLFSRFCNACHVAPESHKLDQYLFDHLFERLPTPPEEYFIKYLCDSKKLKQSGNEYAKQVDAVWDNDYEHRFKDSLSNKDFSDLITYIKIAARQRYQTK
jgi:hypothetical protein